MLFAGRKGEVEGGGGEKSPPTGNIEINARG